MLSAVFFRRRQTSVSVQLPSPVDQVRSKLRLISAELSKELLDISKAQLAATATRQGRLETKASTLTATAGLSLTVATSIASPLLKDANCSAYLIAFMGIIALLGLCSVCLGIWALKVADQATLSPDAVFSEQQLQLADDPPVSEGDSDAVKAAFGLALYRQYITVHIWEVIERNTAILDAKARFVKLGQYSYLGFLLGVSVLEVLHLAGLVTPNRDIPDLPEPTLTMPQKPPPPPPPPPPRFTQDDRFSPAPPQPVSPPAAPIKK